MSDELSPELRAACERASSSFGTDLGVDVTLADPQFDRAVRVHDWRNHVPGDVVKNWPKLSTEARAVAFIFACNGADLEEWD